MNYPPDKFVAIKNFGMCHFSINFAAVKPKVKVAVNEALPLL